MKGQEGREGVRSGSEGLGRPVRSGVRSLLDPRGGPDSGVFPPPFPRGGSVLLPRGLSEWNVGGVPLSFGSHRGGSGGSFGLNDSPCVECVGGSRG